MKELNHIALKSCPPKPASKHFPKQILLVDDEPQLTNILKIILKRNGYEAIVFNDPQKAWQYIAKQSQEIDLVITDLDMPNLSGYELIELIRDQSIPLPIIVVSANSDPDKERLFQSGVSYLLHKPFLAIQLLAKMEIVFGLISERPQGLPFKKLETATSTSGLPKYEES